MIVVYLTADTDAYEVIQPYDMGSHFGIQKALSEDETTIDWTPQKVVIFDKDERNRPLLRADALAGLSYHYVLRRNAVDVMRPLLDAAGCRLLRLECPGHELSLLVPRRVDAFDMKNAVVTYSSGSKKILFVRRYAFSPHQIGDIPIFRVSTPGVRAPFVTEAFVERWRSAGLRGAKFYSIWSGS